VKLFTSKFQASQASFIYIFPRLKQILVSCTVTFQLTFWYSCMFF